MAKVISVTGQTHAVAGAAAGALAALQLHLPATDLLVGVALGAIAGLLPDIDDSHSTIDRRLPVVGPAMGHTLRHRTITHSLVAMVGFALAAHLLLPQVSLRWISVGEAGYGSHLLCDMLTPAGIELPWPLRWRVRLGGWVRTGGWAERLLFLPGFALMTLWAVGQVLRVAPGA